MNRRFDGGLIGARRILAAEKACRMGQFMNALMARPIGQRGGLSPNGCERRGSFGTFVDLLARMLPANAVAGSDQTPATSLNRQQPSGVCAPSAKDCKYVASLPRKHSSPLQLEDWLKLSALL